MPDSSDEFYRIQKLPPYVFAVINEMRAKARAAQIDVIDLGMGNPDGATPRAIVNKLIEAARNARNHRYSQSRGIPKLREEITRRYQANYGVTLDSEKEAIVTIGAKDALAHLLFAIVGPGDAVVSPNPAYPIHQYGVLMAEGHACMLPMPDAATFLNGLEDLYRRSTRKPKMILISFPHNPTTTCVDLDFFREIVRLARASRHPDRSRFRLRRPGLRRLQAAQHSAGGGRQGSRRRDLLDVQELQHGGLARGLLPGQSEDDRARWRASRAIWTTAFSSPSRSPASSRCASAKRTPRRSAPSTRSAATCW